MLLEAAKAALKKYFGYDSFRPLQETIIQTVLEGRDCLVIMPTGGGKSICYQLPALVLPGACIVVSPLIALMKDQVEGLRANGIRAGFLNSSQDAREQHAVENDFFNESLDLLYVSPEKLLSPGFIPLLRKAKINLFAIDEAHCISAWGHDFRQEYTQLGFLKAQFPETPIIALTATADKITRKDILDQLSIPEATSFIASFDRPNLSLTVLPGQNRMSQILHFLKTHPDQSGIIYCLSRKSTETIAARLQQNGYRAAAYHAGLSAHERSRVQEAFINDQSPVICATIAFGMGIDKSNVRWVIHYNLPKNVEGYYQEIGRAGRDGARAETLLFYSYNDVGILRDIIQSNPNEQTDLQLSKLDRIQQFAEAMVCRRRILLSYFGESFSRNCGNCDVCLNPPKQIDGKVIAQKALSAIYRLRQEVPLSIIIDVLRGSGRKELREKGYDQIKTFGAGREFTQGEWQQYLQQLINLGFLEIAYDQHNALKITELGHKALFDQLPVDLVHAVTIQERSKAEKAQKQQREKVEQKRDALFESLRQLRKQLAQEYGLPPYIIFNDATLEAMAGARPQTSQELLRIPGVGERKLEEYGDRFLEAIRQANDQLTPIKKRSTQELSMELFRSGLRVEEIAQQRGLHPGTIMTHLIQLFEKGEEIPLGEFISSDAIDSILQALPYLPKPAPLKSIFEYFDGKYSYEQIKLALAWQSRNDRD